MFAKETREKIWAVTTKILYINKYFLVSHGYFSDYHDCKDVMKNEKQIVIQISNNKISWYAIGHGGGDMSWRWWFTFVIEYLAQIVKG